VLAFVALIIGYFWFRRNRHQTAALLLALNACFLVSFFVWVKVFAIYRYLAADTLLAGVVIAFDLYCFFNFVVRLKQKMVLGIIAFVLIGMILPQKYADFGRVRFDGSRSIFSLKPAVNFRGLPVILISPITPYEFVLPELVDPGPIIRVSYAVGPKINAVRVVRKFANFRVGEKVAILGVQGTDSLSSAGATLQGYGFRFSSPSCSISHVYILHNHVLDVFACEGVLEK
jgi:hypothetical protein